MKPHDPTSTPASSGRHPEAVRGERLRISETENNRSFDGDGSTAHFAVDAPCVKPQGYTAEMLTIMLSDCRLAVGKRESELSELEPTRAMLTEELRRLRCLEADILVLIAMVSPDLRAELDASSPKDATRRASTTSVWSLLNARAKARSNGDLD
ncbi:hypothetical protein ACQ5TV_12685 [Acetobacter ghanensis]|uniref:hypothetical protein n=1 Tax=Acetobacter ghanensis TaxID=431306 RepID=UPI003D33983C